MTARTASQGVNKSLHITWRELRRRACLVAFGSVFLLALAPLLSTLHLSRAHPNGGLPTGAIAADGAPIGHRPGAVESGGSARFDGDRDRGSPGREHRHHEESNCPTCQLLAAVLTATPGLGNVEVFVTASVDASRGVPRGAAPASRTARPRSTRAPPGVNRT